MRGGVLIRACRGKFFPHTAEIFADWGSRAARPALARSLRQEKDAGYEKTVPADHGHYRGDRCSTGVSDGAMSQVTVISGVERRRVWTDEQKRSWWRRDLAEPVSASASIPMVLPQFVPISAAALAEADLTCALI
jgi:hypothetical protein